MKMRSLLVADDGTADMLPLTLEEEVSCRLVQSVHACQLRQCWHALETLLSTVASCVRTSDRAVDAIHH